MPRYEVRGEVPRKRHTQAWRDGRLLVEEVIGRQGFAGDQSVLYHLHTPCAVAEVGRFEPLAREPWVPDAHVQHHLRGDRLPPGGDPVRGRRVVLFNDDVEVALARPTDEQDYWYRNGEGDEVVFVHEGSGTLETVFGPLPYQAGDYVVLPRGTTYRWRADGGIPQRHLVITTPGQVTIPDRYRSASGALLEHAPYHHRDIHAPDELVTHDEEGEFDLLVRVRGGYQHYVVPRHPLDVVGWDGHLFPWRLSIHDLEPLAKRVHIPPSAHQTFAGENFVVCSFVPRPLDWDPEAVPVPYNHSNVDSDEVLYYVSGDFSSRRGVGEGSVTVHPSGLPHGPQPGVADDALGSRWTDELAVMVDTFRPLSYTATARGLDDPEYPYSWRQSADADAPAPGAPPATGLTTATRT